MQNNTFFARMTSEVIEYQFSASVGENESSFDKETKNSLALLGFTKYETK